MNILLIYTKHLRLIIWEVAEKKKKMPGKKCLASCEIL